MQVTCNPRFQRTWLQLPEVLRRRAGRKIYTSTGTASESRGWNALFGGLVKLILGTSDNPRNKYMKGVSKTFFRNPVRKGSIADALEYLCLPVPRPPRTPLRALLPRDQAL